MSEISWCLMWSRAAVRSCRIIPGLLSLPVKFDIIAIFHYLQDLQNCKFAISLRSAAMKTPQMPGWRLRRMYAVNGCLAMKRRSGIIEYY